MPNIITDKRRSTGIQNDIVIVRINDNIHTLYAFAVYLKLAPGVALVNILYKKLVVDC